MKSLALPPQPPLRVLVAHNAYRQRGGEDAVVDSEVALLRAHGHQVSLLSRHNDELQAMPALAAAGETLWSRRSSRELARLVAAFRPDILHVHNGFPLLSPSILWTAARLRVPVVQTLHNYRLLCPQAMLFREGAVCQDCLGRIPWRGALRACYRDSAAQSALVAGMLGVHRAIGSWRRKVARFIALTESGRSKFIAAGFAPEQVVVKPNFVDQPPPLPRERRGLLFAGRLSPEKGLSTALAALAQVPGQRLAVAGDGPLEGLLAAHAQVDRLGRLTPGQLRVRMESSQALVVPSTWQEPFGLVVVEAFAAGLPVIASRIGGLADLVEEGRTGLLFEAGDATQLADRLRWCGAHPDALATMGAEARRVYQQRYGAEANYHQLIGIYQAARDSVPAALPPVAAATAPPEPTAGFSAR